MAAAELALETKSIDVALVMAHDSLLEPEKVVPMAARGELINGAHHLGSPYDIEANGGIPGEGAAALVLVRADSPPREVLFYLAAEAAADGCRGRAGSPILGSLAKRLIHRTAPASLFIDGAGAGLFEADAAERQAVAKAAGADSIPLTTLVGCVGQLGAADGLVRAIALGAALRERHLYPIAGIRTPAPGPLRPLQDTTRDLPAAGLAVCAASPGLAGAALVTLTQPRL